MWLLNGLTSAASIFCCVYWLFPVDDRLGRAASLGFAIAVLYFTFMLFPALVSAAGGAVWHGGAGRARRRCPTPCVVDTIRAQHWAIASAGRCRPDPLAAGQIVMFGLNAHQMRIQQVEIEDGLRHAARPLAARAWAAGRDGVSRAARLYRLLQPYAHDRLSRPGRSASRRGAAQQHTDMFGTALAIMPQWLVLRPKEVHAILQSDRREAFQRSYVSEPSSTSSTSSMAID